MAIRFNNKFLCVSGGMFSKLDAYRNAVGVPGSISLTGRSSLSVRFWVGVVCSGLGVAVLFPAMRKPS